MAIFQRGAADGLNIVVPFGEKRYRDLRPTRAIAPPRRPTNSSNGGPINGGSIDLDGTFALNGSMQPFKGLWDKQQLAIVEATGSPDSVALAFRRAGLHGIGHDRPVTGQTDG